MNNVLEVLKIVASVATIATGLLALFRPTSVYEFTGLRAEGGRGITEIRSILGGLFIALGTVALFYRVPETYNMLGISYLGIGVVRLVSIFVDKSMVKSNIVSLVAEFVLGLILVLPV